MVVNPPAPQTINASGMDAALAALAVSTQGDAAVAAGAGGKEAASAAGVGPASANRKAAHLAFEDRVLPQLKDEFPGLKMSQYKDKCFKLWEKSPENPKNFPAAE